MSSVGTTRGGVIVGAPGDVRECAPRRDDRGRQSVVVHLAVLHHRLAGVFQRGQAAAPLAILGSMVTATGLLLFYQNLLGDFRSWAYGWALVFPTAVGVGLLIHERIKRHERSRYYGPRLIAAGLTLCLVLAVSFETGVFVNGALLKFGGSVVLILLGLLIAAGYLVRLSSQSAIERH